jgi:excisionase family DNA binding protein
MKICNMEKGKNSMPILLGVYPDDYWERLRLLIREELKLISARREAAVVYETTGLTYKPLYKMKEVCSLLGVTRPTIYEWIKHGQLKPHKIRSRVYFLWEDVRLLLERQE